MDLGNLATYGRSPTKTAWVTNPVRRVLWKLIRPYFLGAGIVIDENLEVEIHESKELAKAKIDDSVRSIGARLDEFIKSIEEKVAASSKINSDEVARITRRVAASHTAGFQKELTAIASRLGGLEEEAADAGHAGDTLLSSQKEMHSAIRSLTDRIDLLVRGARLRPGDRLSVAGGNLVLVATPLGTSLLVRPSDHIGGGIVDGIEWEPHVRKEIETAARLDGIAIDAGAYIGVHTITMARYFHTVYAFEPQKRVYEMLCANVAVNDCANVRAENMGLYERPGSLRLARQSSQEIFVPLSEGRPDYANLGNAAALSFEFFENGRGNVRAIAIDDMALDAVALIKVDTQGADFHVLKGAARTIERCRPKVLFEWERDLNKNFGTELSDYYQFFDQLGYEVRMLHDTTPGRQADYVATPRA